jgi:hypothetical protein
MNAVFLAALALTSHFMGASETVAATGFIMATMVYCKDCIVAAMMAERERNV